MQTQTIERTDTDERVDDGTDSDTPKFFHYVKKNKIAESAVMGTHVVALCGEVFPVTKSAKPGSPVCPECKRIYEKLKKEPRRPWPSPRRGLPAAPWVRMSRCRRWRSRR